MRFSSLANDKAKRRIRTSARRVASIPVGDLTRPCFFMHIPKCGGTSVFQALSATIPIHKAVVALDTKATRRAASILSNEFDEPAVVHDDLPSGRKVYALREQLLITQMSYGASLIQGHVLFSEKAARHFGDTYGFVTLVRDPVSRTLSNFDHAARAGVIGADFDEYLQSDVMRAHALSMLRYFSARPSIGVGEEDQALRDSVTNAERFAVIGCLEDLPGFCEGFRSVFGRKPHVYRYNTADTSTVKAPTPSQMQQLIEVMEPELELWEHLRGSRSSSGLTN